MKVAQFGDVRVATVFVRVATVLVRAAAVLVRRNTVTYRSETVIIRGKLAYTVSPWTVTDGVTDHPKPNKAALRMITVSLRSYYDWSWVIRVTTVLCPAWFVVAP